MRDTRPGPIGAKLQALHERLVAEQRRLIRHAAEVAIMPPAGLVSRIAQLEGAIVAAETAMNQDGNPPIGAHAASRPIDLKSKAQP